MSEVDLDGRCQYCSATDALSRGRPNVYNTSQDDAESDDIDVKQVMEHVVGDDADLTAKMM